jgi:hypothetical protein
VVSAEQHLKRHPWKPTVQTSIIGLHPLEELTCTPSPQVPQAVEQLPSAHLIENQTHGLEVSIVRSLVNLHGNIASAVLVFASSFNPFPAPSARLEWSQGAGTYVGVVHGSAACQKQPQKCHGASLPDAQGQGCVPVNLWTSGHSQTFP